MTKYFLSLLVPLCGLIALASSDPARAERRVALVIGNSAYENAAKLDNPSNDAAAIADMFQKAGFDVVTAKKDLGVVDFKRTIRDFTITSRNADIAVVYYAGHGIEVGGINYVLPTDAKLANDLDAEDEAVDMDRLIRSIEPARRFRLVILDACRDNPFSRKMQRTVAVRAIASGLGKVEPTSTDTLIAYAAKAGSTAEDGAGAHSPFTQALLDNLPTPGLDIRIALGRVRDQVLKNTGNRQEPFVYGSLGGSTVSLVPPPPEPKKPVVEANDSIRSDYELAERVGSAAVWDSFLKKYPNGFYADLARAQQAKLTGAAAPATPPAPPPAGDPTLTMAALDRSAPTRPADSPDRVTPDRIAWEKIQETTDPAQLRDFIRRFPNSPLALPAQHRLEILDQAAAQRRQEELERQKAEREAARQRDEEAKRAKALQAEQEKAQREAARQRDEEAKRVKALQVAQEQACKRDEARFAKLKGTGAKARDELARFEQEATCDRVRPQIVALLEQIKSEPVKAPELKAPEPVLPQANTPDLIRSAQRELRRLGCYAGRESGSLDSPTRQAVEGYLARSGKRPGDVSITEDFVSELKQQRGIESCIATREEPKPEPTASEKPKPEPTASEKSKPEPVAREKSKPAQPVAEKRREKSKSESVATRKERARSEEKREVRAPQPRARAEAVVVPRQVLHGGGGYGGGGGGGHSTMTGVGF